jgi:hypothetical protein
VEFVEKMIFQNFFRGKLQFSQHFLGGKFSAEFSLEKNVLKICPSCRKNGNKLNQAEATSKAGRFAQLNVSN